MALPQTLAGLAGLMIACIFVIGMTASDIFPDESAKIVKSQIDFNEALNKSTNPTGAASEVSWFGKLLGLAGVDGIYDFIRNFFSMLVSFIVMIVQYVLLFVGIARILPTEFYLFFALMVSTGIILIVKLIFWSGD